MSSKRRTASWIVLAIVGGLTLLGALASVGVAYFSPDDQIGPVTLSELTGGREDVAVALRARRGTAAAFAGGYAVLFLGIVLVPYRRGDVWAWWAVLVGTLTTTGVILLRSPMLGTNLGLGAGVIPLVVVVAALLLDVTRITSPAR